MNRELAKHFDISQRFKDGAVQLIGEINFALGSIAEPEPHCVAGDVTTFNDVRQHSFHSSGSIRGNGRLARASDQASSNSTRCNSFHSNEHVRQRSLRKIAIDATGFDLDGDFEIAVDRVKMGRPMISVVHGDNDAEKAT
jgi:hypothetical protein